MWLKPQDKNCRQEYWKLLFWWKSWLFPINFCFRYFLTEIEAFVELGYPVTYKISSGCIANKMAELCENQCDLLWSLKRSITESFRTIEGIREKRITLKWNKKLSIADIVIPAFTRICFTDPSSIGENVRRLLIFRTHLGVRTCDIFLCFLSSCWGLVIGLNYRIQGHF